MKKYVMLFSFTVIAVLGMAIYGAAARSSIVEVSIVKVDPLTVEDSITCTGRVETISSAKVTAPETGVIRKVYVEEGDSVTAGQVLMEMNTASAASETSSVPSIPSGYEDLLKQYGAQLQSQSSTEAGGKAEAKKILAPSSGKITSLSVSDFSYVVKETPIAVIADQSGLQVRLSVNESQISDIKKGQKAVIQGVGFKNSSYLGTVKQISSIAKQVILTSGEETVVEVLVSVDHPGSDIKPGYTAKVNIITSQDSGVLVAPYETVRADQDGNEYVFKLDGKRAVKTPIVTKKEFDSGFEVIKGLSRNDMIIANPDNITDGTYVLASEIKKVEPRVESND